MKKLIYVFLLVLFCTVSHAQKRNANGEKMVSKLVMDKITVKGKVYETRTYNLSYNSKNRLIAINCDVKAYSGSRCVYTRRIIMENNGTSIKRKDYLDGKIDNRVTYKYKVDNWVITGSNRVHLPDADNDIVDIRTVYKYQNGRLNEILLRWYVTNKDVINWSPLKERYHYNIDYKDGNPYSANREKQREYFYEDLVNDTNINLHALLWDKTGQITIDNIDMEYFTEWVPFKSYNLLEKSCIGDEPYDSHTDIDYDFDEVGNLKNAYLKMAGSDVINRKITITYLY